LPVSNEISFPPISTETRLTSLFIRFLSAASGWRLLALPLRKEFGGA
jgi:hypothetical protein